MKLRSFLLIIAAVLAWATSTRAADLDHPLILVARPQVHDALFRAAVLVVRPAAGGWHAGFIVNRPTDLDVVFHSIDSAVSDVAAPLYLGGPVDTEHLFALIPAPVSPGGNSVEMLPGLYAAFEPAVVMQIVQTQIERARFFAGHVAWMPGELLEEIRRGAWFVLEPDATLVLRAPDGLWEDLVRRGERAARRVWAAAPTDPNPFSPEE